VADAYLRRGLTTPDLGPEGTAHHAKAAVFSRQAQQQFAGGDRASTSRTCDGY
jgi:hypothetical protein